MIVATVVAENPPELAAALATLGDLERALSCAAAIPRQDYRVDAYINIATTLLNGGRQAEALAAAERALAAADEDLTGFRSVSSLARAAACLGRCGRDSSEELARARAVALDSLANHSDDAVKGLAAVVEGYAAINRPDMSADVAQQMVQAIAAAGDESKWMFQESAEALRAIGARHSWKS